MIIGVLHQKFPKLSNLTPRHIAGFQSRTMPRNPKIGEITK